MRLLQLWKSLPEWAKPVAISLVLTVLVGVWRMISWLINRRRASVDNTVTVFLARNASGIGKTIEEIALATHMSHSKVEASLFRLKRHNQVGLDEHCRWHYVRY